MHSIFHKLIKDHHKYYESSIHTRRFKYEDIIPLITRLEKKEGFLVEEVGKSFEGRDIFCVHWGKGPVDILMWSQMHGDEPTATMGIA